MEKSSAKPVPNLRLKNERERRGWSRNYVAEKIGSDIQTVARWERGTTFPTPFIARAYPARVGYPAIDFVNFTIGVGPSWKVACTVHPPPSGDVFECNANLVQLHIPAGSIQVSFDVYDRMGNSIAAPNGVHTLTYTP